MLAVEQANSRNSGFLQVVVMCLEHRGHILSSKPCICAPLKPKSSQNIVHKLQAIPADTILAVEKRTAQTA